MSSMREIGWEILAVFVAIACAGSGCAQTTKDAGRIEIYVMPYYNSAGPKINVGQYSEGLNAKSEHGVNNPSETFNVAKGVAVDIRTCQLMKCDLRLRKFEPAIANPALFPLIEKRGKNASTILAV
jgi:hypothetical protein